MGENVMILGIACSPREGGNTELLVREALEGALEAGMHAEFFSVVGKNIQPCDGCGTCRESGVCHIQDDMQILYEKMTAARGIIFGTPIYFHSMSAQCKAIIDRSFALRSPVLRLTDKIGGAIVVAGMMGAIDALHSLYFYFAHNHMPAADQVVAHVGEKGGVAANIRTMKTARELGFQMVQLAKQGFRFPSEYNRGLIPHVVEKYKL
ncbi:MAG: flavodoxin family protein [Gammaproteobacteria bacterium]|nr:MAG: flavodoxin family protein [Gammaproteobacteria bacterium]